MKTEFHLIGTGDCKILQSFRKLHGLIPFVIYDRVRSPSENRDQCPSDDEIEFQDTAWDKTTDDTQRSKASVEIKRGVIIVDDERSDSRIKILMVLNERSVSIGRMDDLHHLIETSILLFSVKNQIVYHNQFSIFVIDTPR